MDSPIKKTSLKAAVKKNAIALELIRADFRKLQSRLIAIEVPLKTPAKVPCTYGNCNGWCMLAAGSRFCFIHQRQYDAFKALDRPKDEPKDEIVDDSDTDHDSDHESDHESDHKASQ